MKRLAVLLLAIGLLLAVVLFARTAQTIPVTISADDHGAQVRFSADDTSVFFPSDCIQVSWSVDNIKAVKLDGDGVVGEGSDESCEPEPALQVTFQDGEKQTYTIPKQARIASLPTRLLLVVDLLTLGLAAAIGLYLLWTRLARSGVGCRIDAVLPPLPRADSARDRGRLLLLAALIILIGAAVRMSFLSRPLDHDESWTYNEFASQPPAIILTFYQSTNNHIFHTLLAQASVSVFGLHAWSLRLPAFFAGLLMIAATYAVGRRFYNARVGLLAAALVAGASWLIEYSTNGRGYSMVTLDFLLLLLVASRLRHGGSLLSLIAFAVLSALGLFTIPIMVYPLGAVYLWLGLSILLGSSGWTRWRALRSMLFSLILAGILTAALYLPALLYVTAMPADALDTTSSQTIDWVAFIGAYRLVTVRVWEDMTRDLPVWFVVVLVAGFALGLLLHVKLSRFRVSLAWATLLWLAMFVFLYMTFTYDRLWIFLLPLVLLVASAGLVYVASRLSLRLPSRARALGLALPLVIALGAGAETMRTNAIVLGDDLGRALGTESGVKWIDEHIGDADAAYCAGHCSETTTYGTMYQVRFISIESQPDMPREPYYLLAVQAKQSSDLNSILDYVHQTTKDYVSITQVFEDQDARVYYMVPRAS